MKTLLKTACVAAVCTATFALAGCQASPRTVFKKNTGVKLPEYNFVSTVDTQGGPHGDGELVYTFDFSRENGDVLEERIKAASHWQPLPLTYTLDRLVYEHFDVGLPRVENGYYFFYDEQHDTYEDKYVEGLYSYDFVVAMYDSDNHTAYYYEQHT